MPEFPDSSIGFGTTRSTAEIVRTGDSAEIHIKLGTTLRSDVALRVLMVKSFRAASRAAFDVECMDENQRQQECADIEKLK